MSVVYLIAFEEPLTKTKYEFSNTLASGLTVFSDRDSITFSTDLYPQERKIANNLFPNKNVYSIRTNVPLCYKPTDVEMISNEYYVCAKEQLDWLVQLIKKILRTTKQVDFVQLGIGHPIDYRSISRKQINIEDFVLPEREFHFEHFVYQFVNK